MTNVNVDVQILVTGLTGSGKGLVTNRILQAIRADNALSAICKMHPTRCSEAFGKEQTGLSLEGELLQQAGPKAPKETHSNIPGYPDTDKMIDYLVAKLNETASSETMKTEPLKMIVRGKTGIMVSYREDKFLRDGDRVVALLTAATIDAATDPVGMDQFGTENASKQPSTSQPGSVMARGGYVSRCASGIDAKVTISGIAMMERLPGESDADYRNRNKIPNSVLIPPYVADWHANPEPILDELHEIGAPKPDTHNKAAEMYRQFEPSVQAKFFTNPMNNGGVYPGGLVAGNLVQVITTSGNVLVDNVGAFHWSDSTIGPVVKYYRKL